MAQGAITLFAVLTDIGAQADSTLSQIDDTRLAVGGEAMQGGSLVYKYVNTASKTIPGLKPIAEQLGERFRRAGKVKAKPEPEPKP